MKIKGTLSTYPVSVAALFLFLIIKISAIDTINIVSNYKYIPTFYQFCDTQHTAIPRIISVQLKTKQEDLDDLPSNCPPTPTF